MTELATEIFRLRKLGKSYRDIAKILQCSKSTVCYYLGQDQKEKFLQRSRKCRRSHPFFYKLNNFKCSRTSNGYHIANHNHRKILTDKILDFCRETKTKMYMKPEFTIHDVIQKFNSNPVCYLTGQPIDISKPSTYSFDHIIPRSRGGDNSLNNLGICSRRTNISKADMTPDEFIHLCKQVLEYNGYNITKK